MEPSALLTSPDTNAVAHHPAQSFAMAVCDLESAAEKIVRLEAEVPIAELVWWNCVWLIGQSGNPFRRSWPSDGSSINHPQFQLANRTFEEVRSLQQALRREHNPTATERAVQACCLAIDTATCQCTALLLLLLAFFLCLLVCVLACVCLCVFCVGLRLEECSDVSCWESQ